KVDVPSDGTGQVVRSALALLQGCITRSTWVGQANALSRSHVDWPLIDQAAAAAWKPATAPDLGLPGPVLPPVASSSRLPAAQVIRQRRSCLALDGRTAISAPTFYRMLDHLLPRLEIAPWDMLPWEPLVHLAFFVHRVEGLAPGLYLLERSAA